jgi:hypothetical protein
LSIKSINNDLNKNVLWSVLIIVVIIVTSMKKMFQKSFNQDIDKVQTTFNRGVPLNSIEFQEI